MSSPPVAAHDQPPTTPALTAIAPIPRLALTRPEAAAAIGMSLDSFERCVQPTIRLIRLGRMRLVPTNELERWLEDHAARTLDAVA
jgi:hypothetical protein